MKSGFKTILRGRHIVAATLALTVAACSSQYRNHGWMPTEEEIAAIKIGVDNRATVTETLGTPSSGGVLEDGDMIYVRSKIESFGATHPKVVERNILAVSFNSGGTVSNVSRLSLENGQVVKFEQRITDNGVVSGTFLRQLGGSIGNFSPTSGLSEP